MTLYMDHLSGIDLWGLVLALGNIPYRDDVAIVLHCCDRYHSLFSPVDHHVRHHRELLHRAAERLASGFLAHDPPQQLTPLSTTGIQGGFAPPIPDTLYVITHTAGSDTFSVSTQIRPHGKPQLPSPTTKEFKVEDHVEEITKLRELLRDLPPQYVGAEDLYGRNISILHATDASTFLVLHPSGSGAGFGAQRPSENQKGQFDEAVSIIQKLGA